MRILVINPNSNTGFSDEMDKAVTPLRFGGAVQIDCVSLGNTPRGIETQRDIDAVIDPVCAMVAAQEVNYDGFVIACFADTGVFSAREITDKPVVGICEAGLSTALNAGDAFGVISTSKEARNAELRLIRSHGLMERCVGMEPVDIPVVDMLTSPDLPARLSAAAEKLMDQGAEAIVLGCAGMSPHRATLQSETSLPVIDPTVAGVGTLMSLLALPPATQS